MANSVLRQTIHSTVAKTMLNEIGTRAVKYYFSYGRAHDWGGINVQDALDTLPYELTSRKNSVFFKEITPGDAALVIPRYDWVSGAVYDPYDAYSSDNVAYSGAKTLEDSLYYVVTDELNVYKCISNNNNSVSTVKPTGTATTEITTSDNYVWKYMYSIPATLGNKFLTTTMMPVANAVTKMFYSDGKLERFIVEDHGSGYLRNITQNGTVSSGIETNTDYRKLFGTDTNFLGVPHNVISYTSIGTTTITASIDSELINVTNFIGNGTRQVICTVDPTYSLTNFSKGDYLFITGASTQKIINVLSLLANGSQNIVLTTDSDITDLEVGESITITGATNQLAKTNGLWTILEIDGDKIYIEVNDPITQADPEDALVEYTTNLGTTYLTTRAPLNGSWRVSSILSGSTFAFEIADGTSLGIGVHISGLGSVKYMSKNDLFLEDDTITITGATGTQEEKLNGTWTITSVSALTNITFNVSTAIAAGTYTTDIGSFTHSSKINGLNPNDYIEVNGEVRQIESIQSDIELTLKASGPLLYVGQDSNITKLNTHLEISNGDGYKEENPFVVSGVGVDDQGSNYTANSPEVPTNTIIEFSDPQLAGGRIAKGEVTVVAGKVTEITLTDAGYGYTSAPKAIIRDMTGGAGAGAVLTVEGAKSSAYLEPVVSIETGEILSVVPKNSGIGYTYGVITPIRYNSMTLPNGATSWGAAKITADFNVGKIDSKQADVELSAINGGIHYIKVTTQGVGYKNGATVTVTGDGTGCTAIAGYSVGGILDKIIITNPGKDYTDATVTVTSIEGTASTTAIARAIISPPGGHGKSAIDELNGRTLSLFNRLTADIKIKAMDMSDVSYHQLVLIRQPRAFGAQTLYNNAMGSACYKIVASPETIGITPAITTIPINTIVTAVDPNDTTVSIRFRLITRSTTEMLLQAIDNNDEKLTTQLVITNGSDTYNIISVEKPDVEKLSGDVIYIDNRQAFKPLADQTVSISSRFRF